MTACSASAATAHGAPPRVLMAVPQYPYPVVGGLERQAHELGKALLQLGVAVNVVSNIMEVSQKPHDVVEGIPVHRVIWPRTKLARYTLTPFALARRLVAQCRACDVVHVHHISWFGLFVILAARFLGKPVLTKLPNVQDFGLPGLAASRFGGLKEEIVRLSDAAVAMSRESLRELESIGFPPRRVMAAPNGVRVSTVGRSRQTQRRAGDTCRIAFVGRLCEMKRIDDLLHAFRRLQETTRRPVKLELFGRGPLEAALRRLSIDLGLCDSVLFRGHVDRVRELLEGFDVLALPSRVEGNSNAILEAMAVGLPIVSTKVGGTPMLVGADGARFLVDPGDRGGLYHCLYELVNNEEACRLLGAAMHRRAAEHFDIMRVAEVYLNAYVMLASGRRDEICSISDPLITGG
jgi:glycosyltransferase involved in cell wall biosynthesis